MIAEIPAAAEANDPALDETEEWLQAFEDVVRIEGERTRRMTSFA